MVWQLRSFFENDAMRFMEEEDARGASDWDLRVDQGAFAYRAVHLQRSS